VRDADPGADTSGAVDPIPTYRYPTAGRNVDAPYVTTPEAIVDSMLALASVTAGDTVYDLGSGDGRIPIRAATRYGARGVGIEIQPDLVEKARRQAEEAGVAERVEFRQGDLFEADLSGATVVTLYLLPELNLAVRSKLFRELRPGARVVSHDFHMEEWRPAEVNEVEGRRIYLWRIPDELPRFVEGEKQEKR
jgi:SAM-dependent methyltransferase